ncbi:MAG: hypothetical protein NTZ70_02095 [Methylococcales bacterium]|nr:hypothetical protein [Methylococcales bacterium]
MKRLLALIIVLTPIASQAFDLPWSENARIEKCKDKVREQSKAAGTLYTLQFYSESTIVLDAGYEVVIYGGAKGKGYDVVCYFDKSGKMVDYNER